jgi:putative tryptophan/tyrosine transport system substrate-binding protein
MSDMKRRDFITLLGGAAAGWPLTAIAQRSPDGRRVGVLANEPWPPLEGLRDGMRALGYIDERGLHFEYRFAEGRVEHYPALAVELVRLRADVIVAASLPINFQDREDVAAAGLASYRLCQRHTSSK